MRARAFTLIEVAVASAMAGIIAAAAVGAFAALNRQLVRLQSESVASDNAKSLIDLLVTDVQGVGGGALRPWMALWVEDGYDPSPRRSGAAFSPHPASHPVAPDRFTFATLKLGAEACPIIDMSSDEVKSAGIGPGCCLARLAIDGRIDGTVSAMHLYAINGSIHRQISIESGAVSHTACTATFARGPLTVLDSVDTPAITPADFVGGSLVAASIRTLFLDRDNRLNVFEDARNFNGIDVDVTPDEVRRLAGDVFDFQIQVGYDRELDGRITDQTSATDEWLFNHPADVDDFPIDSVRMVGLGAIVGVPLTDPDYSSMAQVVGSNPVLGQRMHLRAAMGKAALRNLFIFF